MKTSELTGAALDYAVAKCEGWELNGPYSCFDGAFCLRELDGSDGDLCPEYSTDWAQGGPVIEREGIDIQQLFGGGCEGSFSQPVGWQAKRYIAGGVINPPYFNAQTPLIAAMRCFVFSRLGDEVDVPSELVK